MVPLAVKNTDPLSWKWTMDSTSWTLAKDMWQEFSSEWYGCNDDNSLLPDSSLSLPPLAPSKCRSLLVRKCYVEIFDRVWARAFSSNGEVGAIITGQPGTGKTLLDYFILVRLLQLKQNVLFSIDGISLFLFYLGKVYRSSTSALLGSESQLPEQICPKVFIWSIFDIAKIEEPASFFFSNPCLPVQTASPDPGRYKIWAKECGPMRVGMPLWTCRELELGLEHQSRYNDLMDALHKYHSDSSLSALDSFVGTSTLLNACVEDEDDEPLSPEDALNYLLNESIVQF